MHILVVGSGMMGRGVVFDMLRQMDVASVLLIDYNEENLKNIEDELADPRLTTLKINLDDKISYKKIKHFLNKADGLVSCVPYRYNRQLAECAIETGCHFVDLGGNNTVVDQEFSLNKRALDARVAIVPDCGLAPGTVNILAGYGASQMSKVRRIHLRVSGLPQHPKPPLNYKLVFSANGLINEYIEPARIIKEGKVLEVPSLEDIEEIYFPPPFGRMEAFTTSGGTSTLVKTFEGKVEELDYKTIRYPGHCNNIKLLKILGLTDSTYMEVDDCVVRPRSVLEKCLEKNLTDDDWDLVLLRCEVIGEKDGKPIKFTAELIDYADEKNQISSMARTTAFAESVIMLMILRGKIKERGTLYQEKVVPGDLFISEMARRGVNYKVKIE